MTTKSSKLTLRMDDEMNARLNALQECTGRSKSALVHDFVMNGAVSLESNRVMVQRLATVHDNFNRQALYVNQNLWDIHQAIEQLDSTCRGHLANGNAELDSLLREQTSALRNISTYFRDARIAAEKEVNSIVNSESGN